MTAFSSLFQTKSQLGWLSGKIKSGFWGGSTIKSDETPKAIELKSCHRSAFSSRHIGLTDFRRNRRGRCQCTCRCTGRYGRSNCRMIGTRFLSGKIQRAFRMRPVHPALPPPELFGRRFSGGDQRHDVVGSRLFAHASGLVGISEIADQLFVFIGYMNDDS